MPVGLGVPVITAVRTALDPTEIVLFEVVSVKVAGSPTASTFTERGPDVDWLYVSSPEYAAVIDTLPPAPAANAGVNVHEAIPLPSTGAEGHGVLVELPMVALKATVPVGVAPLPETTVETVIGSAFGTGAAGLTRVGVAVADVVVPVTITVGRGGGPGGRVSGYCRCR